MTVDVLGALTVLVLMVLISGALAPLETLGWWAGWFGVAPEHDLPTMASGPSANTAARAPADRYLIYLAGIYSVSGESFAPREVVFLQRLSTKLPDTEVIELFPYSVTNRALTGQRLFASVWRWVLARRLSGGGAVGALTNVRNLWQVVVSADKRYGPMYKRGQCRTHSGQLSAEQLPAGQRYPCHYFGLQRRWSDRCGCRFSRTSSKRL